MSTRLDGADRKVTATPICTIWWAEKHLKMHNTFNLKVYRLQQQKATSGSTLVNQNQKKTEPAGVRAQQTGRLKTGKMYSDWSHPNCGSKFSAFGKPAGQQQTMYQQFFQVTWWWCNVVEIVLLAHFRSVNINRRLNLTAYLSIVGDVVHLLIATSSITINHGPKQNSFQTGFKHGDEFNVQWSSWSPGLSPIKTLLVCGRTRH